jgi:thymidine kinase
MLEVYEPGASIIEDSVANAVERVDKTNKRVLDFIFGVQTAMLDEVIFVSNEILDRVRAETHLFGEFSSKFAGSHSVKDLKAMCEECGQHQIDYVRRDSERLFRHGERMIEVTSELFSNRPQA